MTYEDEDGIDGPFDRAMDRAMKDDATARVKAPTLPAEATTTQPANRKGAK